MQDYSEFLLERIDTIPFIELSIKAEWLTDAELPEFKGTTFHGGFGWALAKVSENLQQLLYKPVTASGHTLPKPFVIVPPLTTQTTFTKGDSFRFTLKLVGHVCGELDSICAALFLWQNMGLGSSRASFSIHSIDMKMPSGKLRIFQREQPEYLMPAPLSLSTYLSEINSQRINYTSLHVNAIVEFRTPTQLLKQSHQYTGAPTFNELQWFIAHRMAGLFSVHNNGIIADINKRLPESSPTPPTCLRQNTQSIQRYSKTQSRTHPLQGFTGSWVYQISDTNSLLLLKLAELLHIGKKTSFGFGVINTTVAIAQPSAL